jgi:hypothetical protein
MTTSAYDLNTLFGELDGQAFESYGEFDERVRELFARHRSAFPTSYTLPQGDPVGPRERARRCR